MDSELAAILTLLLYLSVAIGLVIRSIRRCEDGWRVWFLYIVDRLYVPLMFRCRTTNRPSPIPSEGGALILANHRSPADPLFIWLNHNFRNGPRNIRAIGFMAAAEYCNKPGIKWLSDTMGNIKVNRDGQDAAQTREAIRKLKDGQLLGIFPEGRINYGTDLLPPNPGIAFLALKSKVPVIPVFIHDAPQCGDDLVAPFLTPSRTRVTYGKPIDLSAYYDKRSSPELLIEVVNYIWSHVAELGGVGYAPAKLPEEPPKPVASQSPEQSPTSSSTTSETSS